ncbi:MAG: hypothetical protein KGI59_02080 [Patescibacteria group bacterium]|nr:hypothetical protein [Patescibacteria group bacterium]MDE2172450.1 hypothetical protein [Patescibacteria group bacterium]
MTNEEHAQLKQALAHLTVTDIVWGIPVCLSPSLRFSVEELCSFIIGIEPHACELFGIRDLHSEMIERACEHARIGYKALDLELSNGIRHYRPVFKCRPVAVAHLRNYRTLPAKLCELRIFMNNFACFLRTRAHPVYS